MPFPLDPLSLALALLVTFVGCLVQGALGFGMALVAAPLLLLIDPRLIPGPVLGVGLALSLLMTSREWRAATPHAIGWAVAGGVPGSLLGGAIAARVVGGAMDAVIGGFVLLAVVLSVLGGRVHPRRATLLGAGCLSGVMGTVTSIGGPPLALLYQHQAGATLRATLAGYFTISIALAITVLAAVGRFGIEELVLGAALAPAAFAGYHLSARVVPHLPPKATRVGVLGLSAAAGLTAILRTVL